MKVAISLGAAKKDRTGVEVYSMSLLRELNKLDVPIEYDVYAGAGTAPDLSTSGDRVRLIEVSAWWTRPIQNIVWHNTLLPAQLRVSRASVIHLVNHKFMLMKPCKLLITVHDVAEFALREKYDRFRTFYRKQVMPLTVRYADAVVTVSKNSKADIMKYLCVAEDKIHVIPNGVDDTFRPRNRHKCMNYVRKHYHIDQPFLLYVSRIEHPGKNHKTLLEAVLCLDQISRRRYTLVFVGKDSWRAAEVHATAGRLFPPDRVRFVGHVPDEDVPLFYGAAELLVFPSLYEGFGLPVLEAMAAGLPVVTSRAASLPGVIGDAGLLVNPQDAREIAQAMAKILTNNAVWQDLRQRGLQRAKQFSWSAAAAQLADLYMHLAVD